VKDFVKKAFFLYYDGFKGMTIGKKLWIIIFIKLFIMFAILKIFFFQDFLGNKFETDAERSNYVLDKLTK
jgi:hypothetical protein